MQVDSINLPTAADSYSRTLIRQGCPTYLAVQVGEILSRLDGGRPSPQEQILIDTAYSHLHR